jgi:hypothetical protein
VMTEAQLHRVVAVLTILATVLIIWGLSTG